MLDLTQIEPPLVPVTDPEEDPAPKIIEGVAREIPPATPPRDGSYTFAPRRRISVVSNHW